jgi:shikimate dehydrogenase
VQLNNRIENFITGSTKVYGLIGYPVAHSLSPLIWNTAFQSTDHHAVYVPFELTSDFVSDAIAGLKALNVKGANVTMPHKAASVKYCRVLHYPADQLECVNTLKFKNQIIEGFNTDATGFSNLLANLKISKRVLVLGNGSASKSVIWALNQISEIEITQIARKKSYKPVFLSPKVSYKSFIWSSKKLLEQIKLNDMIINTTLLGIKKEDRLDELEALDKQKIYIDLNYNLDSLVLATAKKNAGAVIDGRELLLAQAYESYRILTELDPPKKIMRSCLF